MIVKSHEVFLTDPLRPFFSNYAGLSLLLINSKILEEKANAPLLLIQLVIINGDLLLLEWPCLLVPLSLLGPLFPAPLLLLLLLLALIFN